MEPHIRAKDDDPGQSQPRADMETQMIKSLITSYFNCVRKTMNDMVPKTIMAFLVNKSKNTSQRKLV
jgi:dynamin 1-like protein